jgi:hypothetical protein
MGVPPIHSQHTNTHRHHHTAHSVIHTQHTNTNERNHNTTTQTNASPRIEVHTQAAIHRHVTHKIMQFPRVERTEGNMRGEPYACELFT